jgi:hypothetical protein
MGLVGSVLLIFLAFCVVWVFFLFLRLVSCLPNVAIVGIHCIINIIYKRTNYKLHRNLSSWTPKFKLVLQGTFVFWEKGGYCCFDNVLTLCLFAYCVFWFVCPRLVSCVWWCSTHIMLWFLLCLFVLVLKSELNFCFFLTVKWFTCDDNYNTEISSKRYLKDLIYSIIKNSHKILTAWVPTKILQVNHSINLFFNKNSTQK